MDTITEDTNVFIAEFDARAIHNPKGLGWKKHGVNGRFMKKPVSYDWDGFLIGLLFIIDVILSLRIMGKI